MNIAYRCLIAMFGVLLAGAVQAKDLLEIYDLALQNDPTFREAQQRLESVRETKPQAKALLLPSISLGADGNAIRRDTKSAAIAALEGVDNYSQSVVTLSLLQPLYRRDYWYQLEQADNVIAQAEAEFQAARIDLIARTVQAYFDVLSAEDDLTVAKAQTKANKRQLDQAQQRFDVGLIAITDVHEARAVYDGSRADLIAAENAVDNAWEALFEITGPIAREPLAKLAEEIPLNRPDPTDPEAWVQAALEQNYSIIAARNAAEALKKTIEIQRSGHYPSLDLVASYGADRTSLDNGTDADTGVIGLQLNVPIYQGGGVSSRVRQAGFDYEAARDALDRVQKTVNRQVRNAYRGVLASISRVEALQATVVSSKSALESTQAGYDVGTRTLVDVLTVQSNMFNATRNYLGSRYDYIINGLLLRQAASTLSRADLERVNQWLSK